MSKATEEWLLTVMPAPDHAHSPAPWSARTFEQLKLSPADARLAASAPELLAALETILQPTVTAKDYSRAIMAVRKAKGETP